MRSADWHHECQSVVAVDHPLMTTPLGDRGLNIRRDHCERIKLHLSSARVTERECEDLYVWRCECVCVNWIYLIEKKMRLFRVKTWKNKIQHTKNIRFFENTHENLTFKNSFSWKISTIDFSWNSCWTASSCCRTCRVRIQSEDKFRVSLDLLDSRLNWKRWRLKK